jgi:hypothetical protein
MHDACLYEPYAALVHCCARAHQRRFGGDLEEHVADGWYHLVMGLARFTGQSRTLAGFLRWHIRQELAEQERRQHRRARLLPRVALDPEALPAPASFCLHRFLKELSEDAAALVALTVGPHLETLQHSRHKRHALTGILQKLGWSRSKIQDVFQEIRKALA